MKNYETGHGKNAETFFGLKEACVALGIAYNPGSPSIMLVTLEGKHSSASAAHGNLITQEDLINTAINNRQESYGMLSVRSTQVLNTLRSCDVPKKKIADAEGYLRKIRGERATPIIKIKDTETTKQISASQMSFDMRLENFGKLLTLVSNATGYLVNEPELSVTGLTAYYETMKAHNQAVKGLFPIVVMSRKTRDEIFYAENTGMLDVAKKVKDYIEGKFKVKSAEAKLFRSFKFRDLSKK